MNRAYDFEIKNPKWQTVFFCVMIAISLLILTASVIVPWLRSGSLPPKNTLVQALVISGFFLFLGIMGLYVCFTEEFSLENGVFYYVKPFRKNQSARVEQVARVELQIKAGILNIVFLDRDGNRLINFYDDGTALRNGQLARALEAWHIPLIEP